MTALAVEWMKFRRSIVARLATGLVVIATPVFSLGTVWLARAAVLDGPNAAQFAVYRQGTVSEAQLLAAGRIMCVAILIASGFVAAWLVGREYADHTIGSLYALPVTLRAVAMAKITVTTVWVIACATTATALTVVASAVTDMGGMTAIVWRQAATVVVATILMGLLGLPFAWVAVATRSYLGAVGAIIGVTAVSQILASLGMGRWVPYVAPAIWAGAAGPDAARDVGTVHLLLSLAAAVLGAAATIRAFDRPLD